MTIITIAVIQIVMGIITFSYKYIWGEFA